MKNFLSWIEIDRKALLENISAFKKLIGSKVKFLAVIKGNAYGHGIAEVSKVIADKVDWFGVNSLDEALHLKNLGIIKPILILGYTQNSRLSEVVNNSFRQIVYDRETALHIARLKKPARIHLKVETGTNRQGTEGEELLELAKILQKSNVEIEGVSMHFATLEEEANAFYKTQLERFGKQLELLKSHGFNPQIKHTASTAAAILYPETYFDMVRVGMGLYGLWPSGLVKKLAEKKGIKLDLKPVLTWKTRVAQVKEIKKGGTIGYGRTYKAKQNMKIVILPVGYYDGYDRHLSNRSRVLVKGKFAPVVGRVMMNMLAVDVTNIPNVKVEDEVVLIGKQADNEITTEELAENIGTINYEVVSRINPFLPREVI